MGSIKFKLWEGEIKEPVADNQFIGMFEITGRDFDDGVIAAGADLICEYEALNSGNITIEVSVPSIGGSFRSDRNFYSPREGQIDYTKASQRISEEASEVSRRLQEMAAKIDDPGLDEARGRLEAAAEIEAGESDPEKAKEAMDNVQEAKKLLALARKNNMKDIRQLELDDTVGFFNEVVRQHARPSEETSIDNLAATAQRAIENNSADFESHLAELRGKNFIILWRQDWFVIDQFKHLAGSGHLFHDDKEHGTLVEIGSQALNQNDIGKLREIVYRMDQSRIGTSGSDEILASANILRG